MKLRTPESFWLLKNGIMHSYPSLQKDVECEIVVLGAGITGALISHTLHNVGFDTVLIDKRDVATGSSAATTSMLQYEIDTPLVDLAEMIGEAEAVECYREGIKAIEELHQLIKKEKIDCGFELKDSLQVAHSKKAVKKLEKEFSLRQKYDFPVEWLDERNIRDRYSMKSFPGILSSKGASIDAFQFAHEIISKNHKKGLPVYDQTEIKKIHYAEDAVELLTESGFRVKCKKIIFCTGFETLSMFKKKYADIITTFATVSEQNVNLYSTLKDTLIWDTDNPYIYLRTTDDKRLLVGGEDIKIKYNALTDKLKDEKAEKLVDKIHQLFPEGKFLPDYNWAGAFGVTKDGLPYIGEHPDFQNAIFVLGLGGNGITFSVQGMRLVLKILAKQPDTLLHYYRFDRFLG